MKRQRSDTLTTSRPTSSSGASSASPAKSNNSSNKPRITFLRGENKITYVKVPPKSDNPMHWFKEGQAIVTKPLNFIIPANSAVNMDISTNVTLKHISLVASGGDDEKQQKAVVGSSSSPQKKNSNDNTTTHRCTLEIAMRDLESELRLAQLEAKGGKKSKADAAAAEERIVNANNFYSVGSVATDKDGSYGPASHAKVKASLISGIYVLRNTGSKPLMVMAMAVDVENRLS